MLTRGMTALLDLQLLPDHDVPWATSSRTRAWVVRKVQLATLIGYQIPENSC
jgi:hypothetical protein